MNGIVIRCDNDDERDKLMSEASEKLGDGYVIKLPTKRLPRFKILKVDQPETDDEAFLRDLRRRNSIIDDPKYKMEIIKREQVKIKGNIIEDCFNIVVQVDGETFNKVMAQGKLKTIWKVCKVVDNVYLRRCYKCYGFNHEAKTCLQPDVACSSCSLPHNYSNCSSVEMKCIVCVNTNLRIKDLKLPENHSVWSKQCPVYQRKLAMSKKAISYID